MRKLIFVLSLVAGMVAMASCKDNPVKAERQAMNDQMRQEIGRASCRERV